MARYYFHLRDGEDRLLDEDGRELNGAEAIEAAALAEARALMAADIRDGRVSLYERLEVENKGGAVVHVLAFENAVEFVREKPR